MLGIDPKLILVLETNRSIPENEFRPADLSVLDASSKEIVVAFASDPRLTAFLERLARYSQGVPQDRTTAPHEGFFDAIVRVRRYGPEDRITERALHEIRQGEPDSTMIVDIECWYPGSEEVASKWLDEVERAAETGEGEVLDRYLNGAAGIAQIRVQAPRRTLWDLAQVDAIATIDALPVPALWWSDAANLSIEDLPGFDPPDPAAPLVAVVDSGVRSAHPLLRGVVYDALPMGRLASGEDQHGHGTAVAALVVHGELERPLARGLIQRPFLRILSVRVLDHTNQFPAGTLWVKVLEEAIRFASDQGAKVINLSIGDASTPFRGPRSTPVASVLDQLARELDLVIVVSSGNVNIPDYLGTPDRDDTVRYPSQLIASEDTGILDPGPAALALTVGAVVEKVATGDLRRKSFGDVGWPSPFTRSGPGIGGAVKPELVAPGGTLALDLSGGGPIFDDDLACFSADGSGRPGALISANIGSSFAAPVVSRVAAAVRAEYPEFDSNLVRALVLQAAEEINSEFPVSDRAIGERTVRSLRRRLVGYGQPRLDDAIHSRDHRAVLVAGDEIEVDGVHLYEIPIPGSFYQPGGERGITVALSYSPDTRARRLDYVASRMKFELVRGLNPDEVVALFLAEPEDAGRDDDDALEGREGEDAEHAVVEGPRSRLSDLRRWERPPLFPSGEDRSSGANQLGRVVFRRPLRRDDGESFLLVVQNTNRWAPRGSMERYGVAVAVWRSEAHAEVYSELEVELRARARAQVEAQVEA